MQELREARARISTGEEYQHDGAAASLRVQRVQPQHAHRSRDRLQRGRDQGDAGDAQDLQRARAAHHRHLRARAGAARALRRRSTSSASGRITPRRGARDHRRTRRACSSSTIRERNYFPMPKDASGRDEVLVGRIRQDLSDPSSRSICAVRRRRSAAEGRGVERRADRGAVASDGLKSFSRVFVEVPARWARRGASRSPRGLAASDDATDRSLRARALSNYQQYTANRAFGQHVHCPPCPLRM